MNQQHICPRCGVSYSGHPAMSRYVNARICPDCGTDEALRPWLGLSPRPLFEWAYIPEEIEKELEGME